MKSLRSGWLASLLLCCSSALSQGILIPASHNAVQGAPFTLTFERLPEMDGVTGSTKQTQKIYRDSAGRQRYEAPLVNGVPQDTIVGIYDVVAGKYIKLDLAAKTAEVTPMRVGRAVTLDVSMATSLPPAAAEADQTLLGTRRIAGLEAWGQRTVKTITRDDGPARTQDKELWLSTHYGLPLMQVMRRGQAQMTQIVVSFDAREPDPALFKIPAGFKVVDAPAPPEPEPGTVRIGGNVSAPKVLNQMAPEFSEEARRKKVRGNVLVSLVVDENGVPQHVKVVRGIGYGLDEKALEAVSQYRFKPALRDGVPVKVEINIEVNFQLY